MLSSYLLYYLLPCTLLALQFLLQKHHLCYVWSQTRRILTKHQPSHAYLFYCCPFLPLNQQCMAQHPVCFYLASIENERDKQLITTAYIQRSEGKVPCCSLNDLVSINKVVKRHCYHVIMNFLNTFTIFVSINILQFSI